MYINSAGSLWGTELACLIHVDIVETFLTRFGVEANKSNLFYGVTKIGNLLK